MLHLRLLGRIVAPVAVSLLLAVPASAQNGRIFGTVTDEDGEQTTFWVASVIDA